MATVGNSQRVVVNSYASCCLIEVRKAKLIRAPQASHVGRVADWELVFRVAADVADICLLLSRHSPYSTMYATGINGQPLIQAALLTT